MNNKIYNTCDELPIYFFYKILDEKELGFLYKNYNGKELTAKERAIAQDAFNNIIYEYSELTFSRKILNKFNAEVKITCMDFRYNASKKVLLLYNVDGDFNVLEILNKLGFSISKDGDIESQINRVIKQLKGLQNKIKIEKANYLKINKVKDEIKSNLEDQATALEMSLKVGYQLNTRVITVAKWISLNNAQNKIAKQYGN